VMENDGGPLRKQGNLNPPQTGLLLSAALGSYSQDAGPKYIIDGVGPQAQLELVFGADQVSKVNLTQDTPGVVTNLTPMPLANITEVYTKTIQAASKAYMSGALGTAYVPGRINHEVVIFQSSLPHVAASTFLFVVLSLLVIIAHFRSNKDLKFTLFGVAAALHRSKIPDKFVKTKLDVGGHRLGYCTG